MTRARLRSVIFILRPALHRRTIGRQRDQVVANSSNPLDQVLAGRLVPAVNGVGVVGHRCVEPGTFHT
jgi:hypothetical protein